MKLLLSAVLLYFSIAGTAQINGQFKSFLEDGIQEIVEENNVVGLSIAVIAGEDEWSGAYGVSSSDDSLNTDHVLALGSITKTVVAACILGLIEDEKLKLNDPIHLYLDNREHVDSLITIKDLLQHTSGVYNVNNHPKFIDLIIDNDSKIFSPEELLDSLLLEPSFARGEKQEYSNTNYHLLGMIIEKVTNRPYYEEIIDRFDMEEKYPSLTIAPQVQNPMDMAHLWTNIDDGPIDVQELGLTLNSLFSITGAAGGFVSKPIDLARFGHDLLSGQLLTEASMDSFYNYHPLLLDGANDYGLGVFQSGTSCGQTAVGHGGEILYTASVMHIEEQDITVAVMSNDGLEFLESFGIEVIMDIILCEYSNSLTNTEESFDKAYDIKVYPNPFDDYITIDYQNDKSNDLQVDVYNDLGQVILSKNYAGQSVINEKILDQIDLKHGIYYVRFTIGSDSDVKKIIKI